MPRRAAAEEALARAPRVAPAPVAVRSPAVAPADPVEDLAAPVVAAAVPRDVAPDRKGNGRVARSVVAATSKTSGLRRRPR